MYIDLHKVLSKCIRPCMHSLRNVVTNATAYPTSCKRPSLARRGIQHSTLDDETFAHIATCEITAIKWATRCTSSLTDMALDCH